MTKEEQRRAGRAARSALSPAERAARSAAICARIAQSPAFRNAKAVLSYRAIGAEADLSALDMAGKTVAYPYCADRTVMRALVPTGGVYRRGAFGIEEPDPAYAALLSPAEIDLVLVPCTAFDAAGGRVGMGGGYYDRFLPACSKAVKLLVAFETQRTDAAVMDARDVRMDCAATEKAFYDCRKGV